jgi:hypothetical protein
VNLNQILVIFLITFGLVVFTIFLARNFRNFNLRVKIVLGILLTGGVALGILIFFVIDSTTRITDSLSQRLDASVSLLAEEQLVNTAASESEKANQFFNDVKIEVERLAEYRISLQSQKAILSQGTYWDAATGLVQLEGGQYGNSPNDAASVFVDTRLIKHDCISRFFHPATIKGKPVDPSHILYKSRWGSALLPEHQTGYLVASRF